MGTFVALACAHREMTLAVRAFRKSRPGLSTDELSHALQFIGDVRDEVTDGVFARLVHAHFAYKDAMRAHCGDVKYEYHMANVLGLLNIKLSDIGVATADADGDDDDDGVLKLPKSLHRHGR